MRKAIFDFDDFSPRNTSFGLLEKIKEHYPGFKVTLFTTPWEIRFAAPTPITEHIVLPGGGKERKFQAFINAIKENRDWIEIGIHGLTHGPEEFKELSYDDAKKRIMLAEKMFLNTGIPYAKMFKAPFWLLSEDAKQAAKDLGFVVVEDGYYNWNLKDDIPMIGQDEAYIAHGHVQISMGNGLEESVHRIYKLPTEIEFGFLSEVFPCEKVDPDQIDFRDPLEQVEILWKGEKL